MSEMIDLKPSDLATVNAILAEHVPDCEVRAFGSRATWNAKDYSDLDLAIVGDGSLDWRTVGRLKESFEESNLPMRVDVLDWHAISESFRKVIERDYLVLQEVSKAKVAVEWHSALWGELATLEYGKSLRGYGSATGHYRVYGTNGQIGWHSEPLCPYASVIIGRKGAYRGVHFSPDPFFVIDTAFYLKPSVELDTRWAYYQLLTQNINDMDSGSAIPSTSREDFYGLSVEVPPIKEQRAIAHVLGTLDDKIELNRRMNETLEEMARALFKSWFVDFEPVRAKMEGRWRRGESLPGLPADLYDIFPDRLAPSELGKIPEGWGVRTLGDVIDIHDKRRVPLNSRQRASKEGPYPYYGAAGIMDYVDAYLFDGVYVLTGEDGSVINTDGHPVVQYTWGQFWVNNHAHVLKGRNGFSEEHLYMLLQQANISAFVTGAVQPKLSQRNLKAVPIVFASRSVCETFSRLIGALFGRIRYNVDEAKSMADQRDALLPRLVSGDLIVTSDNEVSAT